MQTNLARDTAVPAGCPWPRAQPVGPAGLVAVDGSIVKCLHLGFVPPGVAGLPSQLAPSFPAKSPTVKPLRWGGTQELGCIPQASWAGS